MSKERNMKKEGKKQPAMNPKERKAAKKAKKEAMKSNFRWSEEIVRLSAAVNERFTGRKF